MLLTWSCNVFTQNETSFELKKGQIFDVLPLKFNEKADSLKVRKYLRDSVLPRAIELGYIAMPSIPIQSGGTVQGNYSPDIIVFGGWENSDSLNSIMKQLEAEFSDFHSLRREIWTVFYNTHYELKEDLSFKFLDSKFYVATSYWKKQTSDLDTLIGAMANNIAKYNGTLILELSEGESPYGYYYNPDYFFITEWNSEDDFKKFMKENQIREKQNLKHINQFKLNFK